MTTPREPEMRTEYRGFRRKPIQVPTVYMTRKETARHQRYRGLGAVCLLIGTAVLLLFAAMLIGGGWSGLTWFFAGLATVLLLLANVYMARARAIRRAVEERTWQDPTVLPPARSTLVDPSPWVEDGDGRHTIDTRSTTRRIQTPFMGRVSGKEPPATWRADGPLPEETEEGAADA